MDRTEVFEVVVVGGGAAGLSATLYLGRARRRVLLCDAGAPRNAPSPQAHGFLSRDGIAPDDLLRISREQLAPYDTVEVRDVAVQSVEREEDGWFKVTLDGGGNVVTSRKLVLATGRTDELPPVEGLAELWGRGVLHCPYCHGFEVRDKPLAVLGCDAYAVHLAMHLTRFSDDVVLLTNAEDELDTQSRGLLGLYGVVVLEEKVRRVEGRDDGALERVVFEDRDSLARGALFVHPALRQRSLFAEELGCEVLEDGSVKINEFQQTSVPGVYAAGDTARLESLPAPKSQIVAAAGDGATAAVVIDQELLHEDLQVRAAGAS